MFAVGQQWKGKTRLWLKCPVTAVVRCLTTLCQENILCLLKEFVLPWMFPRVSQPELFTGASGSFFVHHSTEGNKAQRMGKIFT